MSQVIRYLTPADGAEEDPHFSGKIRVTDDGRMSVLDAMSALGLTNPAMYWRRLVEANPEVVTSSYLWKFPGARQRDTPVTDRKGMAQIIMLLPGKIAAKFRDKVAVLLERYLDADRSLAEDILRRADERDGAAAIANVQDHPRVQSSASTKELNAAIKAYTDQHKGCGIMYPVVHDTNNLAVTGRTAAQLKASIGAAGSSRDLNTRRQSLAMAFMQLTEAEMIKETGLDPIQVAKRTRELMEPGFRATGLHDQQPEKKYILENRGAMRLNQKLTRGGQLPSHPQAAALPSVV